MESIKKFFRYFFNFELQKSKKKAIAYLQVTIDNHSSSNDFPRIVFLAGNYIKNIKSFLSLVDATKFITKEITFTLSSLGVLNLVIWDDQTKWFKWTDIEKAIESKVDRDFYAYSKNKLKILKDISIFFDLGH